MKTLIKLSILLIISISVYSCFPNQKLTDTSVIVPLTDTVTMAEGCLVYGLPRTVFTVVVDMERIIEKPGPYSIYASDLLGLDNVIKNESEFWSIKKISVKPHEELDPSEYYMIRSNNMFVSNVLSLKREGLILDLNPGLFLKADNQPGTKESEIYRSGSFDLGSDEYFQVQRDTAYKRISIDSSFIRIPYIVEKKKKIGIDQLAERAARKLMELREGKHLILTGEANVFPQSDAAINEINLMEKGYIELFAGKIWKENKTFSYQIIPGKEMTGKTVALFRFSELTGPLGGSAKGGVPVILELIPELKTRKLSSIPGKPVDQVVSKSDRLFYRVPDVVNLKISMGNEMIYSSRQLIYQFGEIVQLPSNYLIGK